MYIDITTKVTGGVQFDVAGYANKLGREFVRLTGLGFLDSRDPYGAPWAPSKKQTGRTLVASTALSRSFTYAVNGNVINVGVSGAPSNYAGYLHFGTAPYVILPKRARLLRFVGSDGNIVFAKRVNHPGLPARYMVPLEDRPLPQSWLGVMDRNIVKYVDRGQN
jgi:phage gpG-like protein